MSSSNIPAWSAATVASRQPSALTFVKDPWLRVRRSASFLALLCVMLIAAADLLFYRQPIGWTLAIYAALVGIAVGLRDARFLGSWHGRVIAIGLIGLCLMLVEHPGFLRIALAILGVLSLVLINFRGWTASVPGWIARWCELIGRCSFQLPADVVLGQRWRRKHGGREPAWQRLAINWIVPVVLSAIFILMFALANPIISTWVGQASERVSRFFVNFGEYVSFGRVLLWLIVGFVVWALLRGRTRLDRIDWESHIFVARRSADRMPNASLIVRCLVLFNIVFAIQMALDLATVLSNGQTLPEGMTYSEYARRGAYPLVATALLAAAFVLIAFPTGLGNLAEHRMRWARRLVYVWIAQNILLTGSAVWRLWMYVEAFGLTRLRFAAAIWMLLVAMGLMWIIWRIVSQRTNSWLLRVNFTTLLIVLYACCLLNFDSIIASYGLEKCRELGGSGPKVDLRYMASLGPESIPALEEIAQRLGDDEVGGRAAALAERLRGDLHDQLRSWQGWTLRRARLAAMD